MVGATAADLRINTLSKPFEEISKPPEGGIMCDFEQFRLYRRGPGKSNISQTIKMPQVIVNGLPTSCASTFQRPQQTPSFGPKAVRATLLKLPHSVGTGFSIPNHLGLIHVARGSTWRPLPHPSSPRVAYRLPTLAGTRLAPRCVLVRFQGFRAASAAVNQ